MTMKREVDFLYEIGTLRFIPRAWIQFLNADFANLAEHTLRVTWIALMIAKYEGGDTGKIAKMALVHDITESRASDVHYVTRLYVERKEEKALEDMLDGVAFADEFKALWNEYEVRESLEAKIVKDADNLEVDLELQEQYARGFKLRDDFYPMRKNAVYAHKLYTETAKKVFEQIYETNPHDWHVKGANRMSQGDWKLPEEQT